MHPSILKIRKSTQEEILTNPSSSIGKRTSKLKESIYQIKGKFIAFFTKYYIVLYSPSHILIHRFPYRYSIHHRFVRHIRNTRFQKNQLAKTFFVSNFDYSFNSGKNFLFPLDKVSNITELKEKRIKFHKKTPNNFNNNLYISYRLFYTL